MGGRLLQKEVTASEEQENNVEVPTLMFGMNDDHGKDVDPIESKRYFINYLGPKPL